MRFVLASASPTRLRVLRQAGFDPEVVVSGVDEAVADDLGPDEVAATLAQRKARAVAHAHPGCLVLACDSVVCIGGRIVSKPASPAEARGWWMSLRGARASVTTGHCVAHGDREATASDTATVWFGEPTDVEIDRYIATEEALAVAGAFQLDGRAAAFITRVEGDPGTVHGVSVAVVRRLLGELDIEVTDLWV
jgi:septum formation protein